MTHNGFKEFIRLRSLIENAANEILFSDLEDDLTEDENIAMLEAHSFIKLASCAMTRIKLQKQ